MELSQGKKEIIDLVKNAYKGEVMLPDFQRNFVWSRNDIEELFKSILEKMFIGTFLIYHVAPNNSPFKTIPIQGVKLLNQNFNPNPNILILDGQQRLSSFFYALYSPDENLKGTTNPYAFFINLNELLNDNIEESVFSWSKKWREYSNIYDKEGNYNFDYLTKERILPLTCLKEDFTEIWFENYKEGYTKEEDEKIRKYVKNILDYNVITLDVPITEKPENIAVLFEKINKTGIKLSIFDLLTARLYKFFNLRDMWENSFDENDNIQKFSNKDKRDNSVAYYIIQAMVLKNGQSIKARDMLKIDETIVNKENWNKYVRILENDVLTRLFDKNEYGIGNSEKWISYKLMSILLTAVFSEKKYDIDKINSWYWSAIFSERYGSSTETKLTRDYKELLKWFKVETEIPSLIKDMLESLNKETFSLKDKKYAGSSVYKGVFNLLFMNDAKDFYENDKLKFNSNNLDDHHIFPKQFLIDNKVEVDYDIILNRTLISSTTNKKISKKAPSSYLNEMLKINNNDENKVLKILNKHFINKEMFNILLGVKEDSSKEHIKNAFEAFIKIREELIIKKISKLILND